MQKINKTKSVEIPSFNRHQFIRSRDQKIIGQSLSEKMFEKRRITILEDDSDEIFTYSQFSFGASFIMCANDQPAHLTESIEPLNSVIIATTNNGVITDNSSTSPENYYPGEALVMSPGQYANVTRSRFQTGLGVFILREKLIEHLTRVYNITYQEPIEFERRLDLTRGSGKRLTNLLYFICSEADDESSALSLGLTKAAIEELLITTVLECVPHSYSDTLQNFHNQLRPVYVKKAVDYVMDHLQQPICLNDLVDISGVTARSLQLGFHNTYGVSPMTFVRDIRLKRARENLLQADPVSSSVADIAEAWQFQHPSQFSRMYQKRFSELPSKTLNR